MIKFASNRNLMKVMSLISFWFCLILTACNGEESAPSAPKADIPVKKTSSASIQNDPQVEISSAYMNGTNEQNKGDKTGSVRIHGTINYQGGGEVTLYEMEGQNTFEIAKTRLVNQSFDFGKLEVSRGFYQLALNGESNVTQVILNPDESELFVAFNTGRLSANRSAPQSAENTGWFNYSSAEFKGNKEIKNLRKTIKDAGAFRSRIEGQIKEKEQEIIAKQHELITSNPGTYLAKWLSWKNPKFPNSKGQFFADIDPLDNSAIRSSALSDRIQTMMRSFSGGTDSGFLGCIDLVKAHFEPNPKALESVLYTMLEGFYNTGKETICQYILDNFIFDEDCGADLSDAIRIRAQGIINLQVGKTPPNFNITRFNGGNLDLMQTCRQNEYTLVMFWASWCHKCEQEIPNIVPMYDQYKSRGFEVVGVSLDQQRSTWGAAIQNNGMTWPNVSQLKAWNSPVLSEYKVTATPTYFLLDKEGTIVLKPRRHFEVAQFLSSKL